MAGMSLYIVLISFYPCSRDVLCTFSRLLVRHGFRLLCARLDVHYLAVYLNFGSLIEQSLMAMCKRAL